MLKGGILKNEEERVDASDIHENVLTRVNEALEQASKCGTCENTYLRQMLPALVTAISVVIAESLDRHFKPQATDVTQRDNLQDMEQPMKSGVLQLGYQQDRLEAYFRDESIRISVDEMPDENVDEKVIKIFSDCGEDISVLHRTGQKRNHRNRHIIVKFVSSEK